MDLSKILTNGSIDDVKRVCMEVGVDIMNNDGSYKTIYEVFNELFEVWNNNK